MRLPARLHVAAVLSAALAGSQAFADGRAAPGIQTSALPPLPQSIECRLPGLSQPARCSRLRRPLDIDRPGGPTIDLKVVVLPAVAQRPRPDPVLFIAGGPGQAVTDHAGAMAGRHFELRLQRNLVFIDQRGTGGSAPLTCADDDLSPLAPIATTFGEARRLERLQACREALQRLPHGDLTAYTTRAAAQDFEAARQALGAAPWNVIAFSYGTRVALEMLRQAPQGVRRAVLDGVAAPDTPLVESMVQDQRAALAGLLRACASEPACADAGAPLPVALERLAARLPWTTTIHHPLSGRAETLTLDRPTLLALLRAPLYGPALASGLPAAIRAAADGRLDPLLTLATALSAGGFASGMHHAVVCSEDVAQAERRSTPPAAAEAPGADAFDRAAAAIVGTEATAGYARACATWPRAKVPEAFHRLGPSPVPVWLLAGGDDPATPSRHAHRVAAALGPAARVIDVPHAGHGVLGLGCVQDAAQKFLIEPDEARARAEPPAELALCLQRVPRALAFRPFAGSGP